jgi:hypothetical protein
MLCSVRRHWGQRMKRREFIGLIGGATVSPLAAHAQQPGKLPTIGFFSSNTAPAASPWTDRLLCSDCATSAGLRVAPSRSSIAGERGAPDAPWSEPGSMLILRFRAYWLWKRCKPPVQYTPHPRPDIRIHTKLDFMRNDYAEYCPNNEGNNWAF